MRVAVLLAAALVCACRQFPDVRPQTDLERQGREIFRDDTFGDEKFWTDTARLHEVVNENIQPLEALSLGLKVDMDRLNLVKFLLHNPFGTSGTRELLRQNAVVGVKAQVEGGRITRIGITCALCHSTVDNALLPGIGHRLDGWPNRDLKVGKILAMLRNFSEEQKAVFRSWPTGFYDPRINFDGKSTPLTLPPAHGLAQVENETYFSDPRIGVNIVQTPDLVTSKLPALRAYQHSIPRPATPGALYDAGRARRGKVVFDANCASCHVGATLTDNNSGVLHEPSATGVDGQYAARTSQKKHRTTPLRGLWQHPPYFHDGSASTLRDVVEHYNRVRNLNLSGGQKRDLVEYLKSL
jgi:cytochrome c5